MSWPVKANQTKWAILMFVLMFKVLFMFVCMTTLTLMSV